jgi:glucose/mannose-6-phosphate isomerase
MDYIELIKAFPCHIKEASSLSENIQLPDFNNILFCGMGGSGIIGNIAKDILGTNVPIVICKNYTIPNHIDENTLVFCISYSGNTEETVDMFNSCLKRGSKIITISSGGTLEQLANENNIQHINVPTGIPPRAATAYLLVPVLKLFEKTLPFVDLEQLEQTGKTISEKIANKIPVVYTSPELTSVGLRWQQELNENSKQLCVLGKFPELNHNQINAFTHTNNNFHIILIKDADDNKQNKKRFEFFENQLRNQKTDFTIINISGTQPEKILKGIISGDFTSYYLSKKLGKDPFNIEIIENLKKSLV